MISCPLLIIYYYYYSNQMDNLYSIFVRLPFTNCPRNKMASAHSSFLVTRKVQIQFSVHFITCVGDCSGQSIGQQSSDVRDDLLRRIRSAKEGAT